MDDVVSDLIKLANRIDNQACIASRFGQSEDLQRIGSELRDVAKRLEAGRE